MIHDCRWISMKNLQERKPVISVTIHPFYKTCLEWAFKLNKPFEKCKLQINDFKEVNSSIGIYNITQHIIVLSSIKLNITCSQTV